MMEFRTPILAIVGVVGLIFWLVNYFNLFKKAQIYLPQGRKSSFGFARALSVILGMAAWSFLTFSLMGPRKADGVVKGKTEVNDIFLVVDVSRSMLAEDFRPNRLEAAKKKILEFVELRPTDRIGVIMFSEKIFTLLPLSTDLKLIRQIVSEIRTGFLGSGTNIGDALGLAVGRASQSLAKNKVIILLTDGVSNVGSMTPIQAAEEAAEKNIKVYTIGIGKVKNQAVLRTQGRYQRIPGGSVDTETLEKISKITEGKSFFAEDGTALEYVFNEIQSLERTEIEASTRIIYKEEYLVYLIVGVLLLVFAEFIRRVMLREAW